MARPSAVPISARFRSEPSARSSGGLRALLLLALLAPSACISRCDPAVVPMPEGFEDVSFNVQVGDLLRRGAHECGARLVIWRNGYPLEHTDPARPSRFRCLYEKCSDKSVCDEVIYDFEQGENGYHMTLVRFGGPLVSLFGSQDLSALAANERCDNYKAMARKLWGQPQREELDGRLEVFEINERVWGAVLCMDLTAGELFVGKSRRIEEMYR
jgi:hypothetical protein